MGDQFSVDTGELGQFLRTLKEAHSSLDEVRKKMQDVTPDGIGTKDLDSACNDFQEHWKYGSEQIAEQTGKFADAVGQSKSNYEEIENALEDAFKQAAAKGGAK
jgi:hypothetical protein